MFKALKSMFGGGSDGSPPAPTGPLGLGLGRAASLDVMRLRLEEPRLVRGLPPETLVITGHGVAQLDADGLLHRYYDDEGTMLQVLCSGGTSDLAVREITLYHLWDELVPATANEWYSWDGQGGRMGSAVFQADGFRFERVWGDPSTPWIPPAEFTEQVTVDDGPPKQIHQKIMPFRREVGPLVETLLIAVERDLASVDPGSITFMIGYGLEKADVSPV